MTLAALISRYKSLHKQQLEIDAELRAVESEMLAIDSAQGRRRRSAER